MPFGSVAIGSTEGGGGFTSGQGGQTLPGEAITALEADAGVGTERVLVWVFPPFIESWWWLISVTSLWFVEGEEGESDLD